MKKNFRLAIFDLDGTLLNTVGDLGNACNYVLSKYNHPTHQISEYNIMLGGGASKLIERALPEEFRKTDYIDKLRKEFFEYYKENIAIETHPYDGIKEVLQTLQNNDVLLAVASNKFHAGVVKLINHFFPEISFAVLFGVSDMMPNKPDPAMVNQIVSITEISKLDVAYFGDSDVDMITGNNAEVTTIGVTWGYRPKETLIEKGAHEIIESTKDILNYFDI